MNEPRVVESVTNECQSLGRAHESSSARAEQLIACLEGEIAKRDEELAACRVAVENCDLFRARIAELEDDLKCAHSMLCEVSKSGMVLRAELAAIKAQEPVGSIEIQGTGFMCAPFPAPTWAGGRQPAVGTKLYAAPVSEAKAQEPVAAVKHGPLDSDGWPEFVRVETIGDFDLENLPNGMKFYAAPVSEAKAQGVVMPRDIEKSFLEWASAQLQAPTQLASYMAGADEVARLNAAPVQQVSVPDGWRVERGYSPSGYVLHSPSGSMIRVCDSGGGGIETAFALFLKAMLAAPAAPAADAGLDYQALFDAIAAATSVYANGAINISVQAFRESLAAHRAKGVV